jgi:hypothetical protein
LAWLQCCHGGADVCINKQKKAKNGSIRHINGGTLTDEEALKMEESDMREDSSSESRTTPRSGLCISSIVSLDFLIWPYCTWASLALYVVVLIVSSIFIYKHALAWRLCVPLGHIGGRRKMQASRLDQPHATPRPPHESNKKERGRQGGQGELHGRGFGPVSYTMTPRWTGGFFTRWVVDGCACLCVIYFLRHLNSCCLG